MRIIQGYLARAMFAGTGLVLAVLTALSGIAQFVQEADNVGKGTYGLFKVVVFVFAKMPQDALQQVPIAVLIGSLLGLGQLASGNELTVIRASGVSVWRLARALGLGAVALALVTLLLSELVAPNCQRYALHLKAMAINQRISLIDTQGVWAKDGNVYVNVRTMKSEDELGSVYLYELDADGRLLRAAVADGARHEKGGWKLEGLRETRLSDTRSETEAAPSRDWQSSLDPSLLDSFVLDYDALSAVQLARYSRYLRGNGLDSNDVDTYLWSRLALPVDVVLMALLALPFAFGPLRTTGTGQRVVVGAMIGVVFFTVSRALLHSGTVYHLDPLLTNFAPTIGLALATTVALARVR